MVEDRFPASGLSAEYGDIVISSVAGSVIVEISYSGSVILYENYTADADGKIYIKEIGELALSLVESTDFMTANGYSGIGTIQLSISIIGATTITKTVTFYISKIDFRSTLDVALLSKIPLSRSTIKITGPGRTECVSFYGNSTVKAYVVKKGTEQDVSVSFDIVSYSLANKIYNTNVSPEIIAALAVCEVSDLIYYNIYTSTDAIVQFKMDHKNYPAKSTFIFMNCFGAQETFTCIADNESLKKWNREFGSTSNNQIQISADMVDSVKINTGNVNAKSLDIISDLLQSDQIALIDDLGFLPIVITEENYSNNSRRDQLKSIDFTYRLKSNKPVSRYSVFKKPKVFSTEFDNTFN